ncbi:MAG: hypothetical protein AAF685_11380 [Cyanobacteria bacterium P01_C01_bin.89]
MPQPFGLFGYLFDNYRYALKDIEPPRQFVTAAKVLAVLQARDELEEALRSHYDSGGDKPSDVQLWELLELDDRLRNCAGVLYDAAPLDEWRQTLRPDESAWWWYLRRPIHRLDRYDWLWSALSIVPLTATVSLLVDMSSRLADGEFLVGSFAVVIQSVLTLLTASSVLTETGRKAMKVVFDSLRIPSYFRQEMKLLLSVMVFGLTLTVHSMLPAWSNYYLDLGKQELVGPLQQETTEQIATSDVPLNTGANLANARFFFERAIAIDSKNIEAYYFLGRVYEEMKDLKKARANYQLALAQNFVHAYNALAYIYIREEDLDKAYDLLQEGIRRADQQSIPDKNQSAGTDAGDASISDVDAELIYSLNKNLGWVRLLQGNYEDAEIVLDDAIVAYEALQQESPETAKLVGGVAYCLFADSLDKQERQPEARPFWQQCQLTSNAQVAEQDRYLRLASERLSQ